MEVWITNQINKNKEKSYNLHVCKLVNLQNWYKIIYKI